MKIWHESVVVVRRSHAMACCRCAKQASASRFRTVLSSDVSTSISITAALANSSDDLGLQAGPPVTIATRTTNRSPCDPCDNVPGGGGKLEQKNARFAPPPRESKTLVGSVITSAIGLFRANGRPQDEWKWGVGSIAGDGGTCRIRGRATRCGSIEPIRLLFPSTLTPNSPVFVASRPSACGIMYGHVPQ